MTRQFSPKTFLRQVPKALLKIYFEKAGIDAGVGWGQLREADGDTVFAAIERLPADVGKRVVSDFAIVNELACEKGTQAIREEALLFGLDWSDTFAAMANEYERAMWTFLHYPARFAAAGALYAMNRHSFSWHRFVGHRLEAATDEPTLAEFGAAMAAHFRKQGRGRHCHVDFYRRVEPERFCYFAYPEDAATTDLGYDEQGQFQRRPRQSAFEVIFAYRPEEGTIQLCGRGGKAHKEAMARLFCIHVLGLRDLPDEDAREPFDLSVLKDGQFAFPTEPQDRVRSVEVRLMRLDLPFDRRKGNGRRLTLEARSSNEAPRALHQLMHDVIDPFAVGLADVQIGRAKLCMTFDVPDSSRAKSLTFEVSYPDHCSLQDDPYDQLARKYLRLWGIERHEDAALAVSPAGSAR
ncbi:MAG: hypothetical protein IT442_17325 [Phycisphaeraceae bacterium]|nr:hypothetical protein [Phycisphaeraceae bacterium]